MKRLKRTLHIFYEEKVSYLKKYDKILVNHRIKHQEIYLNMLTPYFKRHRGKFLLMTFSTLALTISSFFLFQLMLNAGILLFSTILAATAFSAASLVASSFFFFKTKQKENHFLIREKKYLKEKENYLKKLEEKIIKTLQQEATPNIRVDILSILSSKNLNRETKIIEDYASLKLNRLYQP